MLIEKLLVDFLFVIIEPFFARCFLFVTIHAFDGRRDRRIYDRQDHVAYNAVAIAMHCNLRPQDAAPESLSASITTPMSKFIWDDLCVSLL